MASTARGRSARAHAGWQTLAASDLHAGAVLVGGESARTLDIATTSRRDLLVVVPITLLAITLMLAVLTPRCSPQPKQTRNVL